MCWIQLFWNADVAGMFASFGSLPVTFWLFAARTPLPASGNHCESLNFWAPYFAIEKLASLLRLAPSFATQPTIGIVTIGSAPAPFALAMKVSPPSPAVLLEYGTLSKYQSFPRLSALICQLYRLVLFPPRRFKL